MDWPIEPPADCPMFISNVEMFMQKMGVVPSFADVVWGAANYRVYTPIYVPKTMTVKKLYALNGTVVSGNCDIALLDSRSVLYRGGRTLTQFGSKFLANAGTTAQAGTSQWQIFNTTDVKIAAGLYYMVYSLSNTTGKILTLRVINGYEQIWAAGIHGQVGASLPIVEVAAPLTLLSSFVVAIDPPALGIGGVA